MARSPSEPALRERVALLEGLETASSTHNRDPADAATVAMRLFAHAHQRRLDGTRVRRFDVLTSRIAAMLGLPENAPTGLARGGRPLHWPVPTPILGLRRQGRRPLFDIAARLG